MSSSTSAHPPESNQDATKGSFPTASTTSSTELSHSSLNAHDLISKIPTYPDFPTPGILFYDLLPLFASPPLHNELLAALKSHFTASISPASPTLLLGLEARGFLFGPTLARDLGLGFAPVRKKGKLPGETETVGYRKEYGGDEFEVQKSVLKGQKVVVVDDVIATGGTAAAAAELVERCGGVLIGYLFILELGDLNGKSKLNKPVVSLLTV